MSDRLTHGASLGWPALLAGLAVIVLASCTLTRPAPVKQTFLLDVDGQVETKGTPLPGELLVGEINVAEAYSSKAMVYRFAEHRYESDFYNEFLVSPRDMLTQCVLEWLQKARLYQTVAPLAGSGGVEADVLRGFVNDMYADGRDPARPRAVFVHPVLPHARASDRAQGGVHAATAQRSADGGRLGSSVRRGAEPGAGGDSHGAGEAAAGGNTPKGLIAHAASSAASMSGSIASGLVVGA